MSNMPRQSMPILYLAFAVSIKLRLHQQSTFNTSSVATEMQTGVKTYLLDVGGISEQHGEAVNTHAPASCWGQPVLKTGAEALVNKHGFIIALGLGLHRSQASSVDVLSRPVLKAVAKALVNDEGCIVTLGFGLQTSSTSVLV